MMDVVTIKQCALVVTTSPLSVFEGTHFIVDSLATPVYGTPNGSLVMFMFRKPDACITYITYELMKIWQFKTHLFTHEITVRTYLSEQVWFLMSLFMVLCAKKKMCTYQQWVCMKFTNILNSAIYWNCCKHASLHNSNEYVYHSHTSVSIWAYQQLAKSNPRNISIRTTKKKKHAQKTWACNRVCKLLKL